MVTLPPTADTFVTCEGAYAFGVDANAQTDGVGNPRGHPRARQAEVIITAIAVIIPVAQLTDIIGAGTQDTTVAADNARIGKPSGNVAGIADIVHRRYGYVSIAGITILAILIRSPTLRKSADVDRTRMRRTHGNAANICNGIAGCGYQNIHIKWS